MECTPTFFWGLPRQKIPFAKPTNILAYLFMNIYEHYKLFSMINILRGTNLNNHFYGNADTSTCSYQCAILVLQSLMSQIRRHLIFTCCMTFHRSSQTFFISSMPSLSMSYDAHTLQSVILL